MKYLMTIVLSLKLSMISIAFDIKIPSCLTDESLLYLADQLEANIIYTNFENSFSKKFMLNDSDIDKILSEYQRQNSEILKIEYLKDLNTILCSNINAEKFLGKLLSTEVVIEDDKKLVTILENKSKKEIKITFLDKIMSQKRNDFFVSYFKNFPSSTLQEGLFSFLKKEGGYWAVRIEISSNDDKKGETIRKILQDTLRRDDIPSEARRAIAQTLRDIHEKVRINDNIGEVRVIIVANNRFTNKPTYEDILVYLKQANNEKFELQCRNGNNLDFSSFNFWWRKFLSFDALNFLQYLFEKDIFNRSSRYSMEMYLEQIPFLFSEEGEYEGVEILLSNLRKIKSEELQEHIIEGLVEIEQGRLSENSRKILNEYAKKFGKEHFFVDASKWKGDDLPDDYDRWQNFKVSETKFIFEEDVKMHGCSFLLKFYRYKEPVKIGGIPLKKVEEVDYSTPERGYFSCLSARTYEWAKASFYDDYNYTKEDFDLHNSWKMWHSGVDPFILILYRVELSQTKEHKEYFPDIFLVIKILDEKEHVTAIPMKKVNRSWKLFLSWPQNTTSLIGFIKDTINKLETNIK